MQSQHQCYLTIRLAQLQTFEPWQQQCLPTKHQSKATDTTELIGSAVLSYSYRASSNAAHVGSREPQDTQRARATPLLHTICTLYMHAAHATLPATTGYAV